LLPRSLLENCLVGRKWLRLLIDQFNGTWELLDARLTGRKVQMARLLHADPSNLIPDICATPGISRATLYRYLGPSKSTTTTSTTNTMEE
jgi:hypothetical protein